MKLARSGKAVTQIGLFFTFCIQDLHEEMDKSGGWIDEILYLMMEVKNTNIHHLYYALQAYIYSTSRLFFLPIRCLYKQ